MTFVGRDKTYLHNYRKSRISHMTINFKSFEVSISQQKNVFRTELQPHTVFLMQNTSKISYCGLT